MQSGLLVNSNHKKEYEYVSALIKRSEGYYSAWLEAAASGKALEDNDKKLNQAAVKPIKPR